MTLNFRNTLAIALSLLVMAACKKKEDESFELHEIIEGKWAYVTYTESGTIYNAGVQVSYVDSLEYRKGGYTFSGDSIHADYQLDIYRKRSDGSQRQLIVKSVSDWGVYKINDKRLDIELKNGIKESYRATQFVNGLLTLEMVINNNQNNVTTIGNRKITLRKY